MPHSQRSLSLAAAALAVAIACPALAQDAMAPAAKPHGFWLTTPFPDLTLTSGEKGDIPLTLRNAGLPPQRAALDVTGLPDGWQWDLKGGGHQVSSAIVSPDDSERLTLELTPPKGTDKTKHDFQVTAHYGNETATLPLSVALTETKAGSVTLKPELPALRGSPKSTFTFKVKITNDTDKDQLFNMSAEMPAGFTATFKKGYGSEEITSVPIAANQSETATIAIKPAPGVAAGRYPIKFDVQSGSLSASSDLSLEVTGAPELQLTGPQQRLSGQAVAGEERSFDFTVTNTGTAPLTGVTMSATSPNGWKVNFDPEKIGPIAPDADQQVAVSITPPAQAIAGDYVVSLRANGDGVSQSAQFRVTVRTSTVWGAAGIGIIAAAAVVLGLAVMRYGRR